MNFAEGDWVQFHDVNSIDGGFHSWSNGDVCEVLKVETSGDLALSTADGEDCYYLFRNELHAIRKVEKTQKASRGFDENFSSIVFGAMAGVDVSGYVMPSEQPADISQEIEDFMNEVAIRGAIDVALDNGDKKLFMQLTKELTT